MDKDPAFLFYSKDWIEGTAEMSKEEKGVFIDLLAHHHQKKSLPVDTKKLARLVALSETDFLVIWNGGLSDKFSQNGDRLVNRKLTVVMTERSEKGQRNKIIGTLASVVRLSPATYEKKAEAKKTFRVEDFLTISDRELTERLTEWFNGRLKSIEDANGNGDANTNRVGGRGEETTRGYAGQMLAVFKKVLPSYPEDRERDAPALMSIAKFLCQRGGLGGAPEHHVEPVLEAWESLAGVIALDGFYCQKSLKTISNNIQEIVQKALHGDKSKPVEKGKQGLDDEKLKAAIRERSARR